MNNKIAKIASFMILLLAILLIIVFVSFNNRKTEPKNTLPIIHDSGEKHTVNTNNEIVTTIDSGENNTVGIEDSGELINDIDSGELQENIIINEEDNNQNNIDVIEDNISSVTKEGKNGSFFNVKICSFMMVRWWMRKIL